MSNGTAVVAVTFDEMSRLAEAVAASGLFGMKTPAQALALMAIAQAEGMHPALAARDYFIVQGRPVLKSDAMLARFQAAGGKIEWHELTNERADATFSHPQGGSVRISWDLEMAKKAGLAGKEVWKSYGRAMLRARVVSEGIRTVFPGAVVGMLSPEEAADLPPDASVEKDITPAKPLTGVAAIAAKVAAAAPAPVSIPAAESASAIDPASGEIFDDAPLPYADVAAEIQAAIKAKSTDALIAAVALLPRVADEGQRAELDVMARAGWKAIKAKAA